MLFWDFASKATPMYKLLKKDEELNWTEACNKSWEWMKASMTCLPMLMVPNLKIEFHVHTDASNFALRVMLGQSLDNTIDRPIYYASRLMNNAKKKLQQLKNKLWQ
jgi:hypothetical protein